MRTSTDERRRQILEAAIACFARKGFHQASMDDICKEARMSPGSLYRYFRGKDDLIAAIVEQDAGATAADLAAIGQQPDPVAALLDWIGGALGELDDPAATRLTIEIAAEAGRNQRIADVVRRHETEAAAALAGALAAAQAAGRVDPALDPGQAAELLLALIDGLTWRAGLHSGRSAATTRAGVGVLVARLLAPAS